MAQQPVMDPLEISEVDFERMSELMRFLRSESNEHLFVPVAKLQLNHLLATAKQLEDEEPERAKEIMTFARGVAFNIASFSWPGWGDQAQPVSVEDQQLGLQAAQMCVEIAKQIDDLKPNPLWILAVHQLNAKQYGDAFDTFEEAKQLASDDFNRHMHKAWQDFTTLLAQKDEKSTQEFEISVEKLRAFEHEHASFYADQLVTAKNVYLPNEEE